VQFAFAIVAVLWIGEVFTQGGAQAAVVPCLALWTLLLSLGQLNEGRPHARTLEVLRLLVVTPLALYAIHLAGDGVPGPAWVAAAIYILASSAWLLLMRTQQVIVLKQ
jgi:hypothetical protein